MPINTDSYRSLCSDAASTAGKSVDTDPSPCGATPKPDDMASRNHPWALYAAPSGHDKQGETNAAKSYAENDDSVFGHPPTRPLNAEEHGRVMSALNKAVGWLKSAIAKLGKPETWDARTKEEIGELIPGGLNNPAYRTAFGDRLKIVLNDLEHVRRADASNISAGDDLNGAVADAHLFDDIHISTHSLKTATPDALAAILIHEDSHLSIRTADNWYVKPELDNANSPPGVEPYFSNFTTQGAEAKAFTTANAFDNAATIQMMTQVLADRPLASMKYWDDAANSSATA